jgi:aminoglycoside 6'-N-acetyltransferase
VILSGQRVTLRALGEADLPWLVEMLREPGTARWWGDYDAERLRSDYLAGGPDDQGFAIELDGEPIGLVAYWEDTDLQYRHAGMDIALSAERHGQGLGADALRTLGRYLVSERGHWRLTIDPASDNERAIRAFEAVGFRPVGSCVDTSGFPTGASATAC